MDKLFPHRDHPDEYYYPKCMVCGWHYPIAEYGKKTEKADRELYVVPGKSNKSKTGPAIVCSKECQEKLL